MVKLGHAASMDDDEFASTSAPRDEVAGLAVSIGGGGCLVQAGSNRSLLDSCYGALRTWAVSTCDGVAHHLTTPVQLLAGALASSLESSPQPRRGTVASQLQLFAEHTPHSTAARRPRAQVLSLSRPHDCSSFFCTTYVHPTFTLLTCTVSQRHSAAGRQLDVSALRLTPVSLRRPRLHLIPDMPARPQPPSSIAHRPSPCLSRP